MRRRLVLAASVALAVAAASVGMANADVLPPPTDDSGLAYNILTPGDYGTVPPNVNSRDQGILYDGLTPLEGNVTPADLSTYYLSEKFGVQGSVVRTEDTGRPGLTIQRDSNGIPHIFGTTRDDVMFGSGWVAAEDRGLILTLGLNPSYTAALDVPGIDPFGLALSGRPFTPSAAAINFVNGQKRVLSAAGAKGRQVLSDLADWAAGINAYEQSQVPAAKRLRTVTVADSISLFAFIGSIFGNGGGAEVQNADFLARLQAKLGKAAGLAVFRDLREANDPEAPVTTTKSFPYELVPRGPTPGSLVIDPGSESASAANAAAVAKVARRKASNFLVVGAADSADGHPLAVMGPQLGYYYPEIVMQVDLHGPGVDARGISAPIAPYVFIGRGRDFAWSLTSAGSDNITTFLEQLCNPNGTRATRASTHYVYRGRCIAMHRFDAGHLGPDPSTGAPARELTFLQSVHGPISGTVTVHGRPYAVARDRADRGREPDGMLALSDLDSNRVHSPQDFFNAVNHFDTTFNWPYLDSTHTAYFSSGLLPIRAPGTDPSLPTLGTGAYDWRGFLTLNQHPHVIEPSNGVLLNWNNKPAPGWGAASDNWANGSIYRVQLYRGFRPGMSLADDVSIMNRAATEDLRAVKLWPTISRVLAGGPAPDPLAQHAADLITNWVAHGGTRIDLNVNGKFDDPGVAIMDQAWDGIANAVLMPVLGSLTRRLATLIPRSTGMFDSGWYSYVDKDLRTILGDPVRGRFSRAYCGRGKLAACRASLWAAIDAAATKLAAAQGPDPTSWRADATAERIKFTPGLLPDFTMRWTNRSTFQQAIEFTGHGP